MEIICILITTLNVSLFQLLSFAALTFSSPQGGRQVDVTYIGDLTDTEHDVGGKVYVLDQDTLVIDEFSYDGNGFGVYINVATKGRNLKGYAKNRIDVPYPSGSEVSCDAWYDDIIDDDIIDDDIIDDYIIDNDIIDDDIIDDDIIDDYIIDDDIIDDDSIDDDIIDDDSLDDDMIDDDTIDDDIIDDDIVQGEPIEDKYTGDGQLVIDLKQVGVKARDVKWLSVWCTVFEMSFGHVEF